MAASGMCKLGKMSRMLRGRGTRCHGLDLGVNEVRLSEAYYNVYDLGLCGPRAGEPLESLS